MRVETDDATRRELLRLLRASAYATPAIVTLLASRDANASVLCDPFTDPTCIGGFDPPDDPPPPPPPPDDPPPFDPPP